MPNYLAPFDPTKKKKMTQQSHKRRKLIHSLEVHLLDKT
ncbi:unnamed protein product [Brassica rapa subsp. narinosa]